MLSLILPAWYYLFLVQVYAPPYPDRGDIPFDFWSQEFSGHDQWIVHLCRHVCPLQHVGQWTLGFLEDEWVSFPLSFFPMRGPSFLVFKIPCQRPLLSFWI